MNEKIAKWAGWERDGGKWYDVPGLGKEIGRLHSPPLLDESRFLWDAVLFPLIEERGLANEFAKGIDSLFMEDSGSMYFLVWCAPTANPVDLARALVRVIDEEATKAIYHDGQN